MISQIINEIFQIVSISDVIGAILATFFAIMTWWIIEKLTKWREWRALVKAFNELYGLLLEKEYNSTKSIEVVNLILEDIEEKNFKKIVKLNYSMKEGFHFFEGNDFKIEAMIGIGGHHLKIYQYGMPIYNYWKPEEAIETQKNFLEYFKTQCKRENIKIK